MIPQGMPMPQRGGIGDALGASGKISPEMMAKLMQAMKAKQSAGGRGQMRPQGRLMPGMAQGMPMPQQGVQAPMQGSAQSAMMQRG